MLELKQNQKKNPAGFLMLEAVISIFIVGAVSVTFFTVMGAMFRNEFQQRDYVIAANLAQEGIEIVRNKRDNNLMKSYGSIPNEKYCTSFEPSSSHIECKFPTVVSSLPYSGTFLTNFMRTVTISGSGDERSVASEVKWIPKGTTAPQTISVSDTLYPWGG